MLENPKTVPLKMDDRKQIIKTNGLQASLIISVVIIW